MGQQLHKLDLADNSVSVFVHFFKEVTYFLLSGRLALQKFSHFLESNFSTVVNVEVTKGLLEVLILDFALEI